MRKIEGPCEKCHQRPATGVWVGSGGDLAMVREHMQALWCEECIGKAVAEHHAPSGKAHGYGCSKDGDPLTGAEIATLRAEVAALKRSLAKLRRESFLAGFAAGREAAAKLLDEAVRNLALKDIEAKASGNDTGNARFIAAGVALHAASKQIRALSDPKETP